MSGKPGKATGFVLGQPSNTDSSAPDLEMAHLTRQELPTPGGPQLEPKGGALVSTFSWITPHTVA